MAPGELYLLTWNYGSNANVISIILVNFNLEVFMAELINGHAEYSPSRLKGIKACPGVVKLSRMARAYGRVVEQQNEAAAHGSMLHEVMESLLTEHGLMTEMPSKEFVREFTKHLDFDDIILVQWALNCFYSQMQTYTEESIVTFGLEARVSLATLGLPQIEGTSDVIVAVSTPNGMHIHIWDWKFGRYKVSVHENDQLEAYKHGAYASLRALLSGEYAITPETPITVHIVQPAIEYYESYESFYDPEWLKSITLAIEDAESECPTFNPSETNCLWCNCRSFCQVRLAQVQQNAQMVFEKLAIKPELWSEDDVQFLLGMLGELEAVRKGILEDYENRLKEGKPVKGFKLVKGQGRRQFPDFEAVCEYLDRKHPDIEPFIAKPKSPSQLEKELPLKTRRDPEFQNLITKVHGLKMVRDTEDGEAILRGAAAAQEAFKGFV